MSTQTRIVVVGGGAAGLELIARLTKQFKNKDNISVTLIDHQLKHIWKPLYHEVAAGSFEDTSSITDYISYATRKNFIFEIGSLKEINRQQKIITVSSYLDEENNLLLPERKISYDILVIAIGSQANDFGIPGVKENCFFIDNLKQTESLHQKIINEIIKSRHTKTLPLKITIVGGGATGVELAAELNFAFLQTLSPVKSAPPPFQIALLEASNRVLSNLPERISKTVTNYLTSKGIRVLVNTKVTQVEDAGVKLASNEFIDSTLTIWAAGVKANPILATLDGLEVNKIGQLIVNDKLQTTVDQNIFAIGDCACCEQVDSEGNKFYVPARAQAAYQEAITLTKSISNLIQEKSLVPFHYKDYGSLVSLSGGTVGSLTRHMGKYIYIEGWFAKLFYWMLYRKHLYAIHGFKFTALKIFRDFISYIHQPVIKLH